MSVACVLLIAPRLCMLPSKAECIGVTPKRPSYSAVSFFLYFIFVFSSFFNHMEGAVPFCLCILDFQTPLSGHHFFHSILFLFRGHSNFSYHRQAI